MEILSKNPLSRNSEVQYPVIGSGQKSVKSQICKFINFQLIGYLIWRSVPNWKQVLEITSSFYKSLLTGIGKILCALNQLRSTSLRFYT